MTEIVLKNVRKSYGELEVIHGIDLSIASGRFIVFVGPSGCGKSTLLRLIAGLEKLTSGDILIDGEVVNQVSAADRGLAMVFQSYALYPHMSVYRNMAFGLENMRLPRTEIDTRVRKAADMLQITPYLERKPRALSGGQRQRVAIGRAIVRDPKAFLFDEPLSNLDAELRVAMRKELASLHGNIGGTMIYVTHDQTEAMTLADTIVVLNGGHIAQQGTPLDLYNNPKNTFVAGFIGSPRMNLVEGRVEDRDGMWSIVTAGGQFAIPAVSGLRSGDRITFGIRPEHVDIVDQESADMTARVDLLEQLGGETYLYASVDGLPQFTVHHEGQVQIDKGASLPLAFRRPCLHLFDAEGRTIVNGVQP
ncbi:MAG: sn-glycerol-3-phosphate ABC transporter ATP-binding protein UgpC [Geminicoccaceae bacterium]|nr:sn-glycerol-3-phosphate ABC transporter ATP-binding protein UgpC [Geminicoccaceae bacterium]